MTNTMDFNDKETKARAVAAMKHLISTCGETKTMEEVYEAVKQQAEVSREQFEELYQEAKNRMASWETECKSELDEAELDMVVGGGAWDWIKDHAKEIAIVAGAVLVGAAVGALCGWAFAGMAAHLIVSHCVIGGAVIGAANGAIAGYAISQNGMPDMSDLLKSSPKLM